jgi:hypothetical protein
MQFPTTWFGLEEDRFPARVYTMPVSQDAEAEASKPMKECCALRNFRVALLWCTRLALPMDWILF